MFPPKFINLFRDFLFLDSLTLQEIKVLFSGLNELMCSGNGILMVSVRVSRGSKLLSGLEGAKICTNHTGDLKIPPPLKVQKASFQKGFRGVFFSKSEIQKCQGVLFLCRRLPNSPLKTLKIPKKNRASRESCRGVLFSKILRK